MQNIMYVCLLFLLCYYRKASMNKQKFILFYPESGQKNVQDYKKRILLELKFMLYATMRQQWANIIFYNNI